MRSLLPAYAGTDPYAFSLWVPEPVGARPAYAGRGLRLSSTGALVSVPWGRRCRWLGPVPQLAVAGLWNAALMIGRAALVAVRWLWRANLRDPRYLLTVVSAGVLWYCLTHVDPLVLWPSGWVAGVVLGFIWIIRPLWVGGDDWPSEDES